MKLSSDASSASINLQGTFTAPELESMIRKLCILRSQMTPEVTQTPPGPDDPSSLDMGVLIEDKPAMTVAQRADDSFRFWLRNRGIGWCAYNVPLPQAIGVYKFLHSKLGNLKTGPDLFGQQDGRRH